MLVSNSSIRSRDSGWLAICVLGTPLELLGMSEILWSGVSSCAFALVLPFFRGLPALLEWATSAADPLVFFLVPCSQLPEEVDRCACGPSLLLGVAVMLTVRQAIGSCNPLAAL